MSFVYVAVAGAGVSAYGALAQGKSQSDTLNYNAEVQDNNAKASLLSAKLNADKSSLQSNKIMGQNIASYGASGVTSDSGSVLAVMAASAANAETDKQNILYGGQVRSINYQNQASLDRVASNNVLTGSYFSALGSMVKGASKFYSPSGGGGETTNVSDYNGNYDNALGDYDLSSP